MAEEVQILVAATSYISILYDAIENNLRRTGLSALMVLEFPINKI